MDRKGILLISKTLQSIANSSILVMPIMTVDIQTGEIIYRANFFLHSKKEIEFLEVFEEYIFIKLIKFKITWSNKYIRTK